MRVERSVREGRKHDGKVIAEVEQHLNRTPPSSKTSEEGYDRAWNPRGAHSFFLARTFPTARRSVSYDSPLASYYYVRSRLRAAGAGGWAPRQRRGRAHDPVLGRRPAPALGRLATSAPRQFLQRRAGRRQTGLPINVAPTQRTRRGELGGGRGRERSAALLRSSGPRSPSRAPAAFAGRPSRAPGTCCACAAPRPLAQPRPLPLCMDAVALSS